MCTYSADYSGTTQVQMKINFITGIGKPEVIRMVKTMNDNKE